MALFAIVVVATIVVGWRPFLLGMAAFMTIQSPLEPADVILPLYHDGDSISLAVADLYGRGLAPRILVHRREPNRLERLGLTPPADDLWRRLLEARGIPPDAIVLLEPQIRTNRDLGAAIAAVSRTERIGRVIVVLSKPWSRVVRNDLLGGLGGARVEVRFHPIAPRHIPQPEWWRSKYGWLTYFDAYVVWLLRWIRKGL